MKEKVCSFTLTPKRKATPYYEYTIFVSAEDADLVRDYHWCTSIKRRSSAHPYFTYTEKYKSYWLHTEIAKRLYPYLVLPQKLCVVDIINGNTCDLRRSNIRITTRRGDSYNRDKTTSQYCGVFWKEHDLKWLAMEGVKGTNKQIIVGRYNTELEAARAFADYKGSPDLILRERYKVTPSSHEELA